MPDKTLYKMPNKPITIKKMYIGVAYPLIIEDANGITHYWIENGDYDGWSADAKKGVDKLKKELPK